MQVPCRTKNVNKYYKVIAEVGSGTYGKVYKAKCLKTNDFVALKKIDTKDQKIMAEGTYTLLYGYRIPNNSHKRNKIVKNNES